MDSSKGDGERVHYLEQQKGIAFAIDLLDAIEKSLQEDIENGSE